MKASRGPLEGLVLIEPRLHHDQRGTFIEAWSARRYGELGLPDFVQDNLVRSQQGVLRGLHYQYPNEQAKLIWSASGSIYDVAVDIRVGSPSFGRWAAHTLTSENGHQLFVPAGFAHGYVVISDSAVVGYRCSAYYTPEDEGLVRWDDADLAIPWPVAAPLLSERDRGGLRLRDLPPARLPRFHGG